MKNIKEAKKRSCACAFATCAKFWGALLARRGKAEATSQEAVVWGVFLTGSSTYGVQSGPSSHVPLNVMNWRREIRDLASL